MLEGTHFIHVHINVYVYIDIDMERFMDRQTNRETDRYIIKSTNAIQFYQGYGNVSFLTLRISTVVTNMTLNSDIFIHTAEETRIKVFGFPPTPVSLQTFLAISRATVPGVLVPPNTPGTLNAPVCQRRFEQIPWKIIHKRANMIPEMKWRKKILDF